MVQSSYRDVFKQAVSIKKMHMNKTISVFQLFCVTWLFFLVLCQDKNLPNRQINHKLMLDKHPKLIKSVVGYC